jgi:hypothetical protein
MNFIRIALFTMLFNLAVGMTIAMFSCPSTVTGCVSIFDTGAERGGLVYNETFTNQFERDANGTVKPYSDVQSQDSTVALILDKLALGVLVKFLTSLDRYLYGFVYFIDTLFSSMFGANQTLRMLILNGLRFIITLSYIIGAVELWSTRRTLISPGN